MKKSGTWLLGIIVLNMGILSACRPASNPEGEGEKTPETRTPVTVTSISKGPMTEYTELNAVSTFLQKSYVKANTNGYLQSVLAYPGKYVKKGQLLFTLKTKEAQSLGNAINSLDSSFRFSGIIDIPANNSGFVTQLNHQSGDYVQDGESLATISDLNSFVFLLDLPYELRPFVLGKKMVELTLPDGQKLTGEIISDMPTVDAVSQTQAIVIKVNPVSPIPENLVAKVRIVKTGKLIAVTLPKAAVLTNETQDEFWVMKMIDSSTAVKVAIKKGIETQDRIEVLSPLFSPDDKILVSGNYALPDTAKVKILDP